MNEYTLAALIFSAAALLLAVWACVEIGELRRRCRGNSSAIMAIFDHLLRQNPHWTEDVTLDAFRAWIGKSEQEKEDDENESEN